MQFEIYTPFVFSSKGVLQKTSVTSPYADLSLGLNDDYALGWFEPKSIRGHAESYMKFTYILLTARINKAENIVYD